MRVNFITACRNASSNVARLVSSLDEQDDRRWTLTVIDDCSTDSTHDRFQDALSGRENCLLVQNSERKYALRNIVEAARRVHPDQIVATLDGDDSLCNPRTVGLLIQEYEKGADVVWTAHKWDTNGMNISAHMPDKVDPYSWPWVTSHLRTFRSSILSCVSDNNFKDHRGDWFKRGYDQALMLPVLSLAKRRVYLPSVCYQYNIDSSSIPASERVWSERDQISTVNIVRARGLLK